MKPKEWLLKNGHISEIKRGRMSAEHKMLIEKAVRNGENIEGFSVSKSEPAENTERKVERVANDPSRILDIPDERRAEKDWQAYVSVNGKTSEIGMRTVCRCGSSLTYCYCPESVVVVDFDKTSEVTFKTRTSPIRRWY